MKTEMIELPEPTWEFSFESTWRVRWQTTAAPNAFHRFMQRVLLGIVWRRIQPLTSGGIQARGNEAPRPGAIEKGA